MKHFRSILFSSSIPILFNYNQHLIHTCAVKFTVSWSYVCLNSNCPFETHVLSFTILSVSVSLLLYSYFAVIQDTLCRFPFLSVIILGFCENTF